MVCLVPRDFSFFLPKNPEIARTFYQKIYAPKSIFTIVKGAQHIFFCVFDLFLVISQTCILRTKLWSIKWKIGLKWRNTMTSQMWNVSIFACFKNSSTLLWKCWKWRIMIKRGNIETSHRYVLQLQFSCHFGSQCFWNSQKLQKNNANVRLKYIFLNGYYYDMIIFQLKVN